MPELPEVEIVKNTLKELIVGKIIGEIEIIYPKIIRTPSDTDIFKLLLEGKELVTIDRKGKYLLFIFDDITLVSHLRMEGKYLYKTPIEAVQIYDKHTHIVFTNTDGSQLRYHDVRKFGTMDLVWNHELSSFFPLTKLGQEPIDPNFDLAEFTEQLSRRRGSIKQVLLNQEIVSGLGNIYVDDSLAKSMINPNRPANSLTDQEIEQLVRAMREVLNKAIQYGGSTIKSFETIYGKGSMQEHLIVYGQTGKPCFRCGTPIEKIRIAGRGTHFCPNCQKL